MKADYIIRGGHVMDPATGTDEVKDLYVRNMRIIDPQEEEIECSEDRVIDASGMIVTPGLIDFHTHLFYTGSSIGIHPDTLIAQGTTAAVDAGSAGSSNYEAFYRTVVGPSLVKVKGFLEVYCGGQLDPGLCEDFNPALYNVDRMERIVDTYRDNILGLKIRLSRGVVPDETGADYLKAAVDLAEKLNDRLGTSLSVCVHTTNAPVTAGELASCLRPGDIFCHCYQGAGNSIVSDEGVVDPGVLDARKRGVIFDSSNGKGNFGLFCARKALAAGFYPDIISTDLTIDKYNMPPYDKNFPVLLSKYLALGLDLMSILRAVTQTPAKLMHMEGKIGTLAPGAYADIAIFARRKKRFIVKDFQDEGIECRELLVPELTMINGEIQYSQTDFYL